MAERRMFAKKIIDSARFIKMPAETQSFYFHLSMRADDDGIVEAFSVMRLLGMSEDNLKILVAKEFVTVLNDDLVSHITDWKEHNLIRADRKVDSLYKGLLLQVVPNVSLVEKKERADRKHDEIQWDDNGTSLGRHSIGKDSIVKDRVNTDATLISQFKEETNAGEVAVNLMTWFVAYRKRIKKPIKTIAPMKLLITEMRKCINDGYKIEAMQELIEAKEWQSIKLEWVQKELPKKEAVVTGRTIGGYKA